MVTIIKYRNITIDRAIYIKVLSDGTVSYPTVSTTDVLKTTNNKTEFPELGRVCEEIFNIKFQEASVIKYLNLHILQYPLGFSVDHTDQIMKLVDEWFQTGKFRKIDTPFRTDSTYEKELMTAFPSA